MLNTSVFSVFRTFSNEELKKFEDFLNSPYYNKKTAVVNLFIIIKKYDPLYNSPDLDRKKIWKRLYKNKDFNYGVMKNLIYDLGKCAEIFIELQNYEKDEKLRGIVLLKEKMDRNLESSFEKSMKSYNNMLANLKLDFEYFFYKYRALKLQRESTATKNKSNAEKTVEEEKEIEYLTLFYLNECSDIYNTLLVNGSYMNKDYKSNNLALFINLMEKFEHSYQEIIESSLLCLKLILNKTDESVYIKLKKIFIERSRDFSIPFNRSLGLTLREHCSRKTAKGIKEYIKEGFELSLYTFENNLVLVDKNGFIDPFSFNSIVSNACSLNKFKWTEDFIKDNIEKINPEYRDRFHNYSFVTLNIKRKNFSEALNYLAKIEVISQMDHVSVKRFQLMIYYESGHTDELYSLIEAFRNFISKNNKLSESIKLQAGKFIYFVKKFSNIKFKYISDDRIKIEELKDELVNTEVINKAWLLEKADELFNFKKHFNN
jgi:hypothetical protein